MRIVVVFLILGLLVFGCAPQPAAEAPAEPAAPQHDARADRTAVEKVRSDWIAAAERDDAATVAAFYTDESVIGNPEAPLARGKGEIEQAFQRDFPMASNVEARSDRLEVSGDLAYDTGEFSQRLTPPGGEAMDVTGRYLVVLRRQGDGTWKIIQHMSYIVPPATT
ncbi:MAG TPA: DUF4440 domain-containing protein [Thermoanaerobaculia bacterium]|nr:DUF4440 domain-containing protein [Thermoanaerobaculia bacterium]